MAAFSIVKKLLIHNFTILSLSVGNFKEIRVFQKFHFAEC